MSLDSVRAFLLWCTVINGAILILSSLVMMFAGGSVFRMHSRWFPMPRETFSALVYGLLGLHKGLVITLSLVPYIALVIIR